MSFLRSGAKVSFSYTNAHGDSSRRTVDVERSWVAANGARYIRGLCSLKGEMRTFRVDRMRDVTGVLRRPPTPIGPGLPVAWPPRPVPRQSVAPAEPVARHAAAAAPSPLPQACRRRAPRRSPPWGVIVFFGVFFFLVGSNVEWSDLFRGLGFYNAAPVRVSVVRPSTVYVPPSYETVPAGFRYADVSALLAVRNTRSIDEILEESRRRMEEAIARIEGRLSRGSRNDTVSVSYQERREVVARTRFETVTGVTDPAVIERFAAADANGDEQLSWHEVEQFQSRLYQSMRYRHNPTALRPDFFYAAGGGDCEDFALVTAALFRYWGRDAYIASIENADGTFHAVAFVPADGPGVPPKPAHYRTVLYSGSRSVPPGDYIPIDYQHVGAFSTAVVAPATLYAVDVPETLYGRPM